MRRLLSGWKWSNSNLMRHFQQTAPFCNFCSLSVMLQNVSINKDSLWFILTQKMIPPRNRSFVSSRKPNKVASDPRQEDQTRDKPAAPSESQRLSTPRAPFVGLSFTSTTSLRWSAPPQEHVPLVTHNRINKNKKNAMNYMNTLRWKVHYSLQF